MLALNIAAGFYDTTVVVTPGTGDLTAVAERIVTIKRIQPVSLVSAGIAYGAPRYAQHIDPADHAEFAFSFVELLDSDESIADIEYIGISPAGATLGISIDSTEAFKPLITSDGKHVQYWPLVDQAKWNALAFDASGSLIDAKSRILTSKNRRWERSGVHQVRQL